MATREPDGSYLLKVLYSEDRESLGDILCFGADVPTQGGPKELRSKVKKRLFAAIGKIRLALSMRTALGGVPLF
jgi:predicted DNA-binding transcriptional regulator YafY